MKDSSEFRITIQANAITIHTQDNWFTLRDNTAKSFKKKFRKLILDSVIEQSDKDCQATRTAEVK